jgi:hypothetical protein
MNFINCTPHPVNIYRKDGTVMSLPKGEVVPRLTTQEECINAVDGIEIYETTFGKVENLPEPKENTFYIVSRMVLDAKPDRMDLVSVGSAIRDYRGNIIGCRGLSI